MNVGGAGLTGDRADADDVDDHKEVVVVEEEYNDGDVQGERVKLLNDDAEDDGVLLHYHYLLGEGEGGSGDGGGNDCGEICDVPLASPPQLHSNEPKTYHSDVPALL